VSLLRFSCAAFNNNSALQAGLRFDNRKIATTENGIVGEEGYFKAVDKSFDSFNASLGYKGILLRI
jgi:iron complex outermembrane receptor protein